MAEEKKSKKELARELKAETVRTFSMLIMSAFGLIAAFAWNEFVKEAINRYIAPGQGLKSMLIYAILVTVLAVIVSFELGRLSAKYKDEEEK